MILVFYLSVFFGYFIINKQNKLKKKMQQPFAPAGILLTPQQAAEINRRFRCKADLWTYMYNILVSTNMNIINLCIYSNYVSQA